MTPGVPDTTPGPPPPGPPPPGATGAHAGTVPLQRTAAPETARLYAIDWQTFAAWCQTAGLTALPAAPPRSATVTGNAV